MMQVTVPEYISNSCLEIPDKKCYTFHNKKYEMIGVLKKQFKTSKKNLFIGKAFACE